MTMFDHNTRFCIWADGSDGCAWFVWGRLSMERAVKLLIFGQADLSQQGIIEWVNLQLSLDRPDDWTTDIDGNPLSWNLDTEEGPVHIIVMTDPTWACGHANQQLP